MTSKIDQAFQAVGAVNREQWDAFTKVINYAIKRSRGLADEPPETTLLRQSGRQGPGYVADMAQISGLPASTAKLRQQK